MNIFAAIFLLAIGVILAVLAVVGGIRFLELLDRPTRDLDGYWS